MGSENLISPHHHYRSTSHGDYVSYDSAGRPEDEKPSAPMDDPNQTAEIYRKYTMNDEEDSTLEAQSCCGRLCSSCKGCLFTIFECLFLIF